VSTSLETFPSGAFDRDDESSDRSFYAVDRRVSHLDATALATVERVVGALADGPRLAVLDLMASWDSHLPDSLRPTRVIGLGLNERELAANPRLDGGVVHDLNREPRLPFADTVFDAVLCTLSVDYLTRPVEVFAEVARVLRPGGLFLVVFSNRFFPPKVVRIWREADEEERITLVREYFARCGGFTEPRLFLSRGKPRPADDRYAGLGIPSDPVVALFADRGGGQLETTRELPECLQEHRSEAPEDPRERRRWVAETARCPHCGERLTRWRVPQTPFTQWSSEVQLVCFNDACPYYVGGWQAFARQGNPGSYRFMYDPDSNTFHPMPVPTPTAFRDGIEAAEAES
jgi:SAM-dependent methyltransferase